MEKHAGMDTPLSALLRLTTKQRQTLLKLGILTTEDLLRYFPHRYETPAPLTPIAELAKGARATMRGRISAIKTEKTWRKKLPVTRARLQDHTGAIMLIWFHQPYVGRMLRDGAVYTVSGAIGVRNKTLYCSNPVLQHQYASARGAENVSETNPVPIYPETKGLSSRWFYFAVRKVLAALPDTAFVDPIPEDIRSRYRLPALRQAFFVIHMPHSATRAAEAARKRFAFEEIFYIQLGRMQLRRMRDEQETFALQKNPEALRAFVSSLPFPLTSAQERAILHIQADLTKPRPMSRLLEGDVGSGKTVVALAAAHSAIQQGYQVAYMAPTEVLARQHFATISALFRPYRIPVGLITSSECKKFPAKSGAGSTHISKAQLLKWTEEHAINFVVGTHALIQENVRFKRLALVVIDEQHRFGVNQRFSLTQKAAGRMPHLLSMTATPIPRTLALTIYGDLDLTLLDELPPERKRTITEIVPPHQREKAYQRMREELAAGRQAYVICPRILQGKLGEDLLALAAKNVTDERERLQRDVFPNWRVGMLHGNMRPKEKEEVMDAFYSGKTHVLVATSVIEVGVDVPNATVIVIEGADRFGLAQLHQLRGRVARSSFTPYCFVFTESQSAAAMQRLRAFRNAENGFALAEYDLELRGPGELSGAKQWGISDLGMEALKNIKMVEAARLEARRLLEEDPTLAQHSKLCERATLASMLHFE